MARRVSTAAWLALIYGGLIVYGSLYPFAGWRLPGAELTDWFTLPLPRWRIPFDMWANFLGYIPLGVLVYVGALRSGWRWWQVALAAVLGPTLLSYVMEVLQHGMPGRFPSLLDWGLNSAGGLAGVLVAMLAQALGLLRAWGGARARWFAPDSGGALALLAVWPACLVFPLPLPLGLGPPWERLRETALVWLDGIDWAEGFAQLLANIPPPMQTLPPPLEGAVTMLGLLAPIWLAYAVMPPSRRRLVMVPGALVLGLGGATASAALNFGPAHALTWIGPAVLPAGLAAALLALLSWRAPVRLAAALAMVAALLLMGLVAQAPADPYYASSLQAWEHSRYVRFHGLALWLGWLWPVAVAGWGLVRLLRRRSLQ